MPKVYVLNRHGRPLMPCTPAKARHLLDAGKAKVRHRTPFTIQLLYGSTGYTQEVILGVDAGSKTIGLSAATETEELFSAEVKPRNDVVELMSARRQFRRARRNRTTRYRKPRFDNRVRSKHKGWLAPSVEVKIQEHMTAIRRACAILPVSKVVVETAEFDLQLLKAVAEGKPVPQGEDYQKGEMYGHYNVRQYVLWRDSYTCCIMRMTLLRRLREQLPVPVVETRGYITKATRENLLVLPKSHTNDALAIAHGPQGFRAEYLPNIRQADRLYTICPVRHHNRQLHKATILKGGVRKTNQAEKYICGFRLYDKVLYNGIECFVWGRRTSGSFLLRQLNGEKVKDGVSYKHLKLLERSQSYLVA